MGGTHIHYVMQTVIVSELLSYSYISIDTIRKKQWKILLHTIQMLNFHKVNIKYYSCRKLINGQWLLMECYIFYQYIHYFQSLRIGLIIIKAAALAFWVFCCEELDYFLVGMYHMCLVLPDSHKNTWRLSNEEIKGYLNLSVQQNIKSRLMSPPALFSTQSGCVKILWMLSYH